MTDVALMAVDNGDTTSSDDFNQYINALSTDILPRNSSGVVTPSAGSIGTIDYQWNSIVAKDFVTNSITVSPDVKTLSANLSNGECINETYTGVVFPVTSSETCNTLLVAEYSITTDGSPISVSINAKNAVTVTGSYSKGIILKSVSASTLFYSVGDRGLGRVEIPSSGDYFSSSFFQLPVGTHTIYLYCLARNEDCTSDIEILIREVR